MQLLRYIATKPALVRHYWDIVYWLLIF